MRGVGEFACGLARHMQAEEQVLFPAFERTTGMVGGPVAVMNQEHNALRELLGTIAAALDSRDSDAARGQLHEVVAILEAHNMKEENIIYPRTDAALGEREREELVRQMQAL